MDEIKNKLTGIASKIRNLVTDIRSMSDKKKLEDSLTLDQMMSLIYGNGPDNSLSDWRIPEALYTGLYNIIINNFNFINDTYNFGSASNAIAAREYHLDVLKNCCSKDSLNVDTMTTFLQEILCIGSTSTNIEIKNKGD